MSIYQRKLAAQYYTKACYGNSVTVDINKKNRPRWILPFIQTLVDVRAAGAGLEFLRTRVGCIGTDRVRSEDRGEVSDGEEGPGPHGMHISFVFSLFLFPVGAHIFWGTRRKFLCPSLPVVGGTAMTGKTGLLLLKG